MRNEANLQKLQTIRDFQPNREWHPVHQTIDELIFSHDPDVTLQDRIDLLREIDRIMGIETHEPVSRYELFDYIDCCGLNDEDTAAVYAAIGGKE